MQMDLLARDKGEGKPAFLQSLTKDKVGWHVETDFLMNSFSTTIYNNSVLSRDSRKKN